MAYKEHGMWEILDVLQRVHRGEARRQIERVTGRTRKTIGRYVKQASKLGWVPGEQEPSEELAAAVIARLQPGPKDVVAETEEILSAHKDWIKEKLALHEDYKRGLRLSKIHKLLKRRDVHVSYSALYRYACKYMDFGRQASTVRMADVLPGELAEVDFGRLGLVFDQELGRKRTLHALVVTLVFSRHQYVHVTYSQKLKDVIDGLEDAWEYFGGVPKRVVVDNLKAAITKADRYDPTFQRTFNEYSKHRNFVIDATVARHPKGKPHVERQVPYVRESFFRGEDWLNISQVQREATHWCTKTAGGRIHGTTRKQPLVQFEAHERDALLELGDQRFDPPAWGELKVHPDQHIQFQKALYSVPYHYKKQMTKGQHVTVRGDSKLVRIYFKGTLIKTHQLQAPGGKSTDHHDYPPEKTPYTMRDSNYLIDKARQQGNYIGLMAENLLSGTFPWSRLRQAQKLLRLVDKYGSTRVDMACRRAICFDLINVKKVERIVIQAIDAETGPEEPAVSDARVTQLPLKYLRPAQSLLHHQHQKE